MEMEKLNKKYVSLEIEESLIGLLDKFKAIEIITSDRTI